MIGFSTTPSTQIDSRGGRCMYEQVDRLRSQGPAVAVELPEGVRAWLVTRGDVTRKLLWHNGVSRNAGNVAGYEPGAVPWLSPWVDAESMSTAEGGEHQRLRALVAPALTPRWIDALRPRLAAIAEDLLDDLATQPAYEPLDLHTAYSQQLAPRMLCDLLGVPDGLRPEVVRILRGVLGADGTPGEPAAVHADLTVAMRTLVDLRRREPGDDLTSFLIAARVEDEAPLSEQELVDTLLLLIGGGGRTTVALIDHTVRELLANPEQLAVVLAEPDRWTDAVEEALRVHGPVSSVPMRWAKEDIDLGEGVVIRTGDAILVNYLAHGRDPRVHEHPQVFDIDREDKEHLAFGAGPHFCPGAHLARLEALVAVPALFERFPGLALAVPPDDVPAPHSFIANDVAALPVLLRHSAAKAA